MFALSDARAIQISPLFRRTCEGDIRCLSGDVPIREVTNHSESDNAHIVRISRERLRPLSHSPFYPTWQDVDCHSVS
jgi:hypothetical protein